MKLIENWWECTLKSWSIRLAAAVAILAGIMTANYGLLLGLIAFIPSGPLKYLLAFGVALVVFIIPWLARVLQQPKLSKPDA